MPLRRRKSPSVEESPLLLRKPPDRLVRSLSRLTARGRLPKRRSPMKSLSRKHRLALLTMKSPRRSEAVPPQRRLAISKLSLACLSLAFGLLCLFVGTPE
ncbi:hypothetical protein K440DRAFT_260274 [Wilcoxina mikolae CBS 423.85]|nr:hypothetical protein K440DRAFT_260274 [Wilcoxina mikolae CBS 423.85]